MAGKVRQSRIPWNSESRRALRRGTGGSRSCHLGARPEIFLDPTFGGALVPGTRNVFTTTVDLTGIAFLTDARRLSPLISRLRFQTTARSDVEWDLDYDVKKGRINASTALIDYRFGPITVGGGDAFLRRRTKPSRHSASRVHF